MVARARTRNYTRIEWDALRAKLDNPEERVVCPRCGKEIVYEEIGNSISVYCQSGDCIFGGIRGL